MSHYYRQEERASMMLPPTAMRPVIAIDSDMMYSILFILFSLLITYIYIIHSISYLHCM